MIARSGLADVW